MTDKPIEMAAPRGKCGRWHYGGPLRRFWNRVVHGRKGVYVCQRWPEHNVLQLWPEKEEELEFVQLPEGFRFSRGMKLVHRLTGKVTRPVGSQTVKKWVTVRQSVELGHRYERVRWE